MNHAKERLGTTKSGKTVSLDLYANFQDWSYDDHREAIWTLLARVDAWSKMQSACDVLSPMSLEIASIITDYYAVIQYHIKAAPCEEQLQEQPRQVASG